MSNQTNDATTQMGKFEKGMSEGVTSGFGLAMMMTTMGIATGGVAVIIGSVVAVGLTLLKFFDDSAEKAKIAQTAEEEFAKSIRGSTITQLEAMRGSLLQNQKVLLDEQKVLDESARKWTNWGILGQLAGYIFAHGLETQRDNVKKILEENIKDINITIKAIGDLTKSGPEQQKYNEEKLTAAIRDEFLKRRQVALNELNTELANNKDNAEARRAIWAKYSSDMKQIKDDELKAKQQLEDTYFSTSLEKSKQYMMQRNLSDAQINITQLAFKREHLNKQLSDLVAEYESETITDREYQTRRAGIEQAITQNETEQMSARKSLRQEEANATKQISDAEFEEILNNIRTNGINQINEQTLTGLKRIQAQEQIEDQILARERMRIQEEQKLLTNEFNAGKISLQDYQLKYQQAETRLSQISLTESQRRMRDIDAEKQKWLDNNAYILGPIEDTYRAIGQAIADGSDVGQAALDALKQRAIETFVELTIRAAENALAGEAIGAGSTAAVAAMMATTAISAAPAATLVSIASFGGAALAGEGAIMTALATTRALSLTGLKDGTLVTSPMLALIGEGGDDEVVAPRKTFKEAFKDILMPELKRDVIAPVIANNNAQASASGTPIIIQVQVSNTGNVLTKDFVRTNIVDELTLAIREAGLKDVSELIVNKRKLAG
jgi:hypothetical protein